MSEVMVVAGPERSGPSEHIRQGESRQGWAAAVLGGIGLAAALLGASWSDEERVSPIGLLTALHPLVLIGAAMIGVAIAWRLLVSPRVSWIDGLLVAGQVVVLHGVAALVESAARFPVAWLHAGFADHIAHEGTLLTGVDARFSWPGFFTSAAVFLDGTGITPETVLRWTPLVAELLVVALVHRLARALGAGARSAVAASALFASTDWVGQIYFAPQTLAVILVLAALLVALRLMPEGPAPRGRIGRRWWAVAALPGPSTSLGSAWYGVVLIAILSAVTAASHQMSPFLLTLELGVVVVVARRRPGAVVWFAGLVTVAWITFMARAYWSGHLATIVGELGNVDSVLQSAVSDRVQSGDGSRRVALAFRALVTAGVIAAAGLGILRRWRLHRRLDLAVLAMGLVPVVLVATQSYGGEILLRVYLYALPFLAIAAAWAFIPGRRPGRLASALLATTLALAAPSFMVARYGNEAFERVTAADVVAVQELYRIAPQGASIVAILPSMPWRFQEFTSYDYEVTKVDDFIALDPTVIATALPVNPRGTYLFVNDAQLAQLEIFYGLGANYGIELTQLLDGLPWMQLLYENGSARIYHFDPAQLPKESR